MILLPGLLYCGSRCRYKQKKAVFYHLVDQMTRIKKWDRLESSASVPVLYMRVQM